MFCFLHILSDKSLLEKYYEKFVGGARRSEEVGGGGMAVWLVTVNQ
jgi:hypothetical protein